MKVLFGMQVSLDGFVNDRNGEVGRLYPDMSAFQQTEMLQELIRTTGAVIMGRHTYDMANGDFTGYEFQVPIFVVTHHVPPRVALGESGPFKFNFVCDSIPSAVQQAKAAAGDRNVTVVGGANLGHQLLNAGLVDEIELGIVPVLLGAGLRLFERLDRQIELEQTARFDALGVTYLRYRVVR